MKALKKFSRRGGGVPRPGHLQGDPISKFKLEHEDYLRMGEMIAGARKPTLFVFEGGYAVDALGINTVNVLSGFEGKR
jgi:acetoin utilization deacetylase AcuC-like enzyme